MLAIACTDSSHRTDDGNCRTSDARMSADRCRATASALLIKGTVKSRHVTPSNSAASRSAAPCIKGV